jgi:glycosyltransferase involved in cell wall biosynthesis
MGRFGVAVPSYLGRDCIAATLRSLSHQTHQDWVCVVVNDGEEDGTGTVVRDLGDPRIRYVCDGRRRGQFANFNRAVLEVMRHDVDFVRLLCADDVLYPYDLADMLRVFTQHPRVGLVATHYDGIDAQGRLLFQVDMARFGDRVMRGREYLLKGVAVGNTIGGPSSVAVRREAIETAGLFDTRVNHSGESDLWHRVAAHWDVAWVGHRPGIRYRFHDASITGRGKYSVARFTDPIQLVRRVACTEPLFGPRWWVHQYTIGRLHSINLQLIAAMAARRRWDGVKAGLIASLREGLIFYAPFWIPRLPYQIARIAMRRHASRRLLWRRVHESLQPPRRPVVHSAESVRDHPSPPRAAVPSG